MTDVKRSVAEQPWKDEGVGNHRALIRVDRAGDLMTVVVPWRRRDRAPEKMAVRLFQTATGTEVTNLAPIRVNREFGEFAFQATQPGEYALYFMPYTSVGPAYGPVVEYLPADYSRADPEWARRNGITPEGMPGTLSPTLPRAEVVEIQSRTDFDRFDPMEVVATQEEMNRLLSAHRGSSYLLFPEDRRFPVRMTEYLPLRWIERGPADRFAGQAQPNEYYAFQVAVYALQPLADVTVQASDFRTDDGRILPASSLTCFNLQGVDWLGRPFTKKVAVEAGRVQALWFGVDLPERAGGTYRGTLTVLAGPTESSTLEVALEVSGPVLKDRGDRELWRHSRIRWLNSTIGIDHEPTAGYPALQVRERTVECLGRQVRFGDDGLPASIRSLFAPSGDRLQDTPVEILAQPVEWVTEVAGQPVEWQGQGVTIAPVGTGRVTVTVGRTGGPLSLQCRADLEFDGHIDYYLTLKAADDVALSDVRLKIRLRREIARYMMGFGCKGGYRPPQWAYRWSVDFSNNMVWIGDAHAGLQCKLKHTEDVWALLNLRDAYGLPPSWANDGKGGCDITEEDGESVLIDAFAGPRQMKAGETIVFRFALLITPTKVVDTDSHWVQRYYHGCDQEKLPFFIPDAVAGRASIMNLHHGNVLMPHINYPFLKVDDLKRFVQDAHDQGLKLKFYYTIRELSNFTVELWMLRSLGDEIFMRGSGGFMLADHFAAKKVDVTKLTGHAWLCEHLVEGYAPAWHQPLPDGQMDAAIGQTGLSRWHNYYLEGLRWLVEEVGIDGLYLDGIGYDREIMKRVRKVLDRTRSGCLIDFHTGNNFSFWTGMNNSANQYMEHFPFVDSLWFGEAYNYDEPPEYWLVEMSGIPFGLMNEMLEGGGNPWRGMLMGMSTRLGYIKSDPRALWKFWDEFGLKGSQMIGFWVAGCPVRTDHADIRATVYVRPNKALVSLASWAQADVVCHLQVDWKALGLDPAKVRMTAPGIAGFQEPARFAPGDGIPVAKARGLLVILDQS